MTAQAQKIMIDLRLGDLKTTGKIASRNAVYSALRNYIILKAQELYDPVFVRPSGSVGVGMNGAEGDMPNARLDVLQEQLVLGTWFFTQPQPAYLNITRRTIVTPNLTMAQVHDKAVARLAELDNITANVLDIKVPRDTRYNFGFPATMTIAQLIEAFADAMEYTSDSTFCKTWTNAAVPNCVNVTLPATYPTKTAYVPFNLLPSSESPKLNLTAWTTLGVSTGMQTMYNLVKWTGNTTAYLTCNLPLRNNTYVGMCVDMDVSCVASTNDTVPYTCTKYADNSTVVGTIADTDYRVGCELPCDKKLDCNALCECYGTCSDNQYCLCTACAKMNGAAQMDASFQDIWQQAVSASSVPGVSIFVGRMCLIHVLFCCYMRLHACSSRLANVDSYITFL